LFLNQPIYYQLWNQQTTYLHNEQSTDTWCKFIPIWISCYKTIQNVWIYTKFASVLDIPIFIYLFFVIVDLLIW